MADSSFWAFSTNSIYLNPIFARDVNFGFRFIFGWIKSQSMIFKLYMWQVHWRSLTYGGFPRHRHFLGFLMCPSKHQHGPSFLRLLRETAHFQSPFTTRIGYGWPILILNPGSPRGHLRKYSIEKTWYCIHGNLMNWVFCSSSKKKELTFFNCICLFLEGGGCHVGIVHAMNWKAFCLG